MTHTPFRWAGLAATTAAGLVAAAPVPKDRDAPVDLKAVHAIATRAVESGKWPSSEDEKTIRQTVRHLLDEVARVGGFPPRKSPVGFDAIKPVGVYENQRGVNLCFEERFVIAGNVDATDTTNSVILASGDVRFTSMCNSIVIGRNVRFGGAYNCIVIAEEVIYGTSVEPSKRGIPVVGDAEGKAPPGFDSVLVAGRWMRLAQGVGVVCHVIRPDVSSIQPDKHPNEPSRAVRVNHSNRVLVLNAEADFWSQEPKDNRVVKLKTPLAR